MSNGVNAGRLLARLITGGEVAHAALYDPSRLGQAKGAATFVTANAAVATHFVGDRVKGWRRSADDLAPGEGDVVSYGGQLAAAYRDEEGTLHTRSARCTHLGCLVQFNSGERTWDCPCHASRFGLDGRVLNGPAVEPLPPLG